jgi:predicted HTH domain antitoxin
LNDRSGISSTDSYLDSATPKNLLSIREMKRRMMYQLTVNYPETLPDVVGSTQEQFEQEAKWAMAVKLFEMKRLSSGMAAALIEVDRVTFLLKLADYGVPMIDLSEADLLSDVANA